MEDNVARASCLSDTLYGNFVSLIAKGFDNIDKALHTKLKFIVSSINTLLFRDRYHPLVNPRSRSEGDGFCSPAEIESTAGDDDVCCHLPKKACVDQKKFADGPNCKWNSDGLDSLEDSAPEVKYCKTLWQRNYLKTLPTNWL